jgi:hypothetical protein
MKVRKRLESLFNTAYGVVKAGKPFSDYELICEIQFKKGLDLGVLTLRYQLSVWSRNMKVCWTEFSPQRHKISKRLYYNNLHNTFCVCMKKSLSKLENHFQIMN